MFSERKAHNRTLSPVRLAKSAVLAVGILGASEFLTKPFISPSHASPTESVISQRITTEDITPRITPDPTASRRVIERHNKIAFSVVDDFQRPIEDRGIWISNPDGSDQKIVMEGGRFPRWAPTGDRLIGYVEPHGSTFENGYFNMYDFVNNTNQRLGWIVGDPRWHPNGRSLLFSGWNFPIRELDLETGVFRSIGRGGSAELFHSQSASPDGNKLLFLHHTFGFRFDLNLASWDETDRNRQNTPRIETIWSGLTENKDSTFDFQWNPNSRNAIFTTQLRGEGDYSFFQADTQTKSVEKLDVGINPLLGGFALSKGADRIVTQTMPNPTQYPFTYDVNIIDLNTRTSSVLFNSSDRIRKFTWSPDESEIAYTNEYIIKIVRMSDGQSREVPGTSRAIDLDWYSPR